jgi:hypothetical protein
MTCHKLYKKQRLCYSLMIQIYYVLRKISHLYKKKIVNVMKQLESWFLSNNLIINTGKTKAILFQGNGTSSSHRPSLYFNNIEITYTSNLKFQFKLAYSYTIPMSKIE